MKPPGRALRQGALLAVGLALAGYIVHVWLILPLSRQAEELAARLSATRQRMAELPAKAEALGRLREDYAETVKALEALEATVMLPDGVPYFLRDLEAVSDSSGATVVSVSMAALARSKPYVELPLTINVSGSYAQISAFADELLAEGRAMAVKTLRLAARRQATAAGGSGRSLDATIGVVLHVMPEGGGTG